MFQSMMTRCGGRSATASIGAAPSVIARTANPESDNRLAERFDGSQIPIDDEYLLVGFDGEHGRRDIRDTQFYSSLTLL